MVRGLFIFQLICLFGITLCQLAADNFASGQANDVDTIQSGQNELYRIEGKVFPIDGLTITNSFLVDTKVIVNYGQYYGYLK